MSAERGTLEALIGELTTLLGPLVSLTPTAAPAFLAGLGLPVTDAQAAALTPALSATTGGIGRLIDLALQLEAAIQAGDVGAIVSGGAAAVDQISRLLSGFNQLQSALASLNLPGAGPIVADFPGHLFNNLLAHYLRHSQGVLPLLELAGVLDRTDHNVGVFDPAQPFYTTNTFHFDRVAGWLGHPADQLAALYDWGQPGFDGKKALAILDRVAAEAGLPSLYDPSASPPALDLVFAGLSPRTDLNPRGLELTLHNDLAKGSIERGRQAWTLALTLDTNVLAGTRLLLQPGKITAQPPDATTLAGRVAAEYRFVREATDPMVLLSIAGGSRVSVEEIAATFALNVAAGGAVRPEIGASLKRGRVLVTTEKADGFIATLLGGFELDSSFEVGIGFSLKDGVFFNGAGALEIQLASHIQLGPVEVVALRLSVGVAGQKFPVSVTADLKADLGPLVAVVQGLGFSLNLALVDGHGGNLGPLDVKPGFKLPTGVGLSLDAGVIKGGGALFFDPDRQEYGGTLELVLLEFLNLHAVGLITTRMPDGSSGFSLLIIITADFGPGIQLGFGFTLLAVGGLIGLNRTMLFQPLMDGVRTGAIDSIMFPRDVVANAQRIISDLRAIFPPQAGTFLIGPEAKLGWGQPTLISLALGVIIEIPPGDIAILGVLKLALPAEEAALILIQVNFAGAFEFSKKRLYFFASLFDSRVLFITIEGEIGVLLSFGDDANFVVSIGGFHPQYNPPPLPFPTPRRLALDIINESFARIRCEGYFAVTSNSVQFGTHAEYFFGFDALSVEGHSSFDALLQFSPFHFTVSMSIGFSLKVFGLGVFGLDVSLTLDGPSPYHAQGTASIEFFFFSIDVGIDITWGEARNTLLPPVDVMPILAGELGKASNWRARLPAGANLLVSLRTLDSAEADFVLHPAGTLQVSQRAIPLDLTIDKVGNQRPGDANRFALTVASGGLAAARTLQERFAPAQFKNFDDAGKLSQQAYAPQDSGLELSATGNPYGSGAAVTRVVRYDLTIIDTALRVFRTKFASVADALFSHSLGRASVARSTLSASYKAQVQPFAEKVVAGPETFAVASKVDNTAVHPAAASFTSQASAQDYLGRLVAADPTLAGSLHVLPGFEVNA